MSDIHLYNVNNGIEGFRRISALLHAAHKVSGPQIVLHMSGSWFNAPMSAALYAVLKRVQESHKVYLNKKRSVGVERILSKNGFFPHVLGSAPSYDTFGTTVPFRIFDRPDEEVFNRYIDEHITHHHSFPKATEALRQEINRSLLELFVNAQIHSRSAHGIATCGQFFPNKNLLEFCLADAGVGIHTNVRELEPGITDEEAIVWAMQEGHTTRKQGDGVPGGLGLEMLKQFIGLNNGRLILMSGRGYLELNSRGDRYRKGAPSVSWYSCPRCDSHG